MHISVSQAVIIEERTPLAIVDNAPAWAAILAACEEAAPTLPWAEIWEAACQDRAWQTATEGLASACTAPDEPFLRSWVDAWLRRTVGAQCYGQDGATASLRRVRPGGAA